MKTLMRLLGVKSSVRLDTWVDPFRDIRDPKTAHKYRRLRECTKTIGDGRYER